MTTDEIVLELRNLPAAPDALRERVRALPEPQPRFVWTLPRVDFRRTLLVVAPAVVVLGLGGAAISGLLAGARSPQPQPLAARTAAEAGGALGGSTHGAADTRRQALKSATTVPSWSPAVGARPVPAQLGKLSAQPLPPSATRLNRYQAWLRVRVDREDLSNAARRAMSIARTSGGYVASVDVNTPGTRGRAVLLLRIPVTKVEDAVMRLGRLGEVTAQRVRIEDLQRQSNQQENQILKLRTRIATLQEALKNPALPADQRIRLELQLEQAKRSLGVATHAHSKTVREGTLATVSITFAAPTPAAVAPHHPGRLERSARDAGTFLLKELAWLLYAIIVAGPIALIAAGAVVAGRAGRRRLDRRLLEQA